MRSAITVLLLALLFWGCAGEKRVTDTGFLQKRKFRSGWDLTIGRTKLDHQVMAAVDPTSTPDVDPITEPSSEKMQQELPVEELHASIVPAEEILSNAEPVRIERSSITTEDGKIAKAYAVQAPDQEDLLPKKRWNRLAVPAFVASLGIVAIGLYTTSTIWVIVAIAVTFILAGISIRQIREREEAGKGFAIAALLIALLAVVATAIATAVVGFV